MYRIGILNATMVSRSGGGFHYIMSLIEGLRDAPDLEVVVFYDDPAFPNFCFESPRFQWVHLKEDESILEKVVRAASTLTGIRSPILGRYKVLRDYRIDLLITFDSLVGFHLKIPFLSFIGDVMYKYYPQLPEYPLVQQWIRDLTTKLSIKHAEIVVVDSEECKKDLVKFFNVPSTKLKPIHLCAPPHIYKYANGQGTNGQDLITRHHLPPRFIFYPAQFWGHKNHANLVKALDLIKRKYGVEVPAVFVGSAWESLQSVRSLLRELNLERQVYCLGYLPEKEIVALYKKADALVFASFADYTSIPLVEAMVLGTPIVCSNVFSLPEQVGDAGLFFDPFKIEEIANAIYRVWTDEELRKRLVANGHRRAEELSLGNFAKGWQNLIHETLEHRN